MRALDKEDWLKVLHPHWSMSKVDSGELVQVVKVRQMMNDLGYSVETGPTVMYFLTRRMNDKDIGEIQRMIPRRDFVDKWKHLEQEAHDLARKLTGKEAGTSSGSWKILTKASPENILFLSLTTKQQSVDQKVRNFFGKWRQTREKLPFPEMEELRITPQLPEYQKILDDAFLLLLDGKLRSHSEVVNFLKPYEPPPPPPPPPVKRGRGKAAAASGGPSAGKRGRKPKGQEVAAVPSPAELTAAPRPEAKPAPAKAALAAGAKKAMAAPTVKSAPAKPAKGQARPAAKKPPAKKTAARRSPARKALAKKAPAKKTVGKKVPAKKLPAKKLPAKKLPAKKLPAKKLPLKRKKR